MTDISHQPTVEDSSPSIDWAAGMGYRRAKVAAVMGGLYLGVIGLHLVSWGYLVVWGMTGIFGWRALLLV